MFLCSDDVCAEKNTHQIFVNLSKRPKGAKYVFVVLLLTNLVSLSVFFAGYVIYANCILISKTCLNPIRL